MQDQLRRLAAIHSEDVPVLSVYVDMRPHTGGRPGVRDGLVVLNRIDDDAAPYDDAIHIPLQ